MNRIVRDVRYDLATTDEDRTDAARSARGGIAANADDVAVDEAGVRGRAEGAGAHAALADADGRAERILESIVMNVEGQRRTECVARAASARTARTDGQI